FRPAAPVTRIMQSSSVAMDSCALWGDIIALRRRRSYRFHLRWGATFHLSRDCGSVCLPTSTEKDIIRKHSTNAVARLWLLITMTEPAGGSTCGNLPD